MIRSIPSLIAAIIICNLAGAIGGIFTARSVTTWYSTLSKPSFSPPSWVFAPVWTTLYTLMGVAAWMVWRKGVAQAPVRTALIVFAIQLLLNAVWSPVFFGLRSPGYAFLVILALWAAIALTIVWFLKASTPAGLLLLPYIAWVSFAAVLNYELWRLNR